MEQRQENLCLCGCGGRTAKRFIHGHNGRGKFHINWKGGRQDQGDGYMRLLLPDHPRAHKSGYVLEHILVAEKALGHTLPLKARVHHLDEIRKNNKNCNLVICQDQAYHMLLHVRLRALRACGNPDFRKCKFCKTWDDPQNMYVGQNGRQTRHRNCFNDYRKAKPKGASHAPH